MATRLGCSARVGRNNLNSSLERAIGCRLLLALSALVLSCGDGTRPFLMGATLWPPFEGEVEDPDQQFLTLVDRTLQAGDTVQLQLSWSPDEEGLYSRAAPIAHIARQHGRKFILAIEWMNGSRTAMRSSSETPWSFADPTAADLFERQVTQAVEALKPLILVLGVEVNYLALFDPEGFRSFVRLFHDLRERLTDTTTMVSFQYEALQGHDVFGPDRSRTPPVGDLVAHFDPAIPALGLSTYPGRVFDDPADLDLAYFEPLLRLGQPVFIFETAWHTSGSGSPSEQERYVEWLLERHEDLRLAGLIWASTCDTLGREAPTDLTVTHGMPAWFGSLGLWGIDGRAKPAVRPWLGFARRSYQGRGGNGQTGPFASTRSSPQ